MSATRLGTPQRISAISMGVVALAAFLPWISIFGITKLGIEGDGIITLVFALTGAVVFAVSTGVVGNRTPGRASRVTLLVLAVLVALVALVDMNGIAAIGLYLTLFAGVAWVIGAVWDLREAKASPSVEPAQVHGAE